MTMEKTEFDRLVEEGDYIEVKPDFDDVDLSLFDDLALLISPEKKQRFYFNEEIVVEVAKRRAKKPFSGMFSSYLNVVRNLTLDLIEYVFPSWSKKEMKIEHVKFNFLRFDDSNIDDRFFCLFE